jgi:subfamily B ATP-binding cassette protein MsbA
MVLFVLCILLNMIFAILSAVSIAIVQPIFSSLFTSSVQTPMLPPIASDMLTRWKDLFYSILNSVVHGNTPLQTLVNISLLIPCIFFLKNIVKYHSNVLNTMLSEKITQSIRNQLFEKITSLSISFFHHRKAGNLMSLVTNDVSTMNSALTPSLNTLVRQPLEILAYILLLISLSPRLTFIAFSTSIVSLFLIQLAQKFLRKYAARIQSAMSDYTAVLQETITGIRVVKAFTAEHIMNTRFANDTARYAQSVVQFERITAYIPAFSEMFAIIALSVVLYVGGSEVFAGTLSASELMTFLFSLFAVMAPISNVANVPASIQRGIVAAENIFEVLDTKPTVVSGTRSIHTLQTGIEIRDLSFGYDERKVLHNISLHIPKGKTIAFVGASGSGKSTLADLLIRFYDPQEGMILLDGIDIRDYDLHEYRSLFGVVSQEALLFHDSIRNNIRFGSEENSDRVIEQAAHTANAHEFITALPKGYDTLIGDRGVMLSGGQRQRVSIARALAGKPSVLIFDEATSALDAESERVVQSAIDELLNSTVSKTEQQHKTTAVIIAHRLSTVINADEIIVFDAGNIVERGTHSELLALSGVYKRLVELQFAMQQ